jgi:DNA-binding NarL/FixJ family response regulator
VSNIDIKEILLLEDRIELRTWLMDLLAKSFPKVNLTCESTLAGALQSIQNKSFQIALVDLGLPDGSGVEAIQSLAKLQEHCFIVVVTIFDDSEHLFSALKAGAHGYLLKDEKDESLIEALLGILEGKPPISPRMAMKMVQHFHHDIDMASLLSLREKEVLSLISKGLSVKQAAEQLDISWHTVGDHVKSLYKKLNINSRAQAVKRASELGL